jgi:hypothetical protein
MLAMGGKRSKTMKKSRRQFLSLSMTILVMALSGACMAPFEAAVEEPVEPVEYDAQGRRLVTITVDPESASRAVNLDVARTYIDFYEVVFKGPLPATDYYSAVARRGAGNRLSVRVPVGNYEGYLNAGHLVADGDAVLLAQAAATYPGAETSQPASATWTFALEELTLHVKGSSTSADIDPIFVKIGTNAATTLFTSTGIPYYKLESNFINTTVEVVVTTGATKVVDYNDHSVEVIPLIRTSDKPPAVVPDIQKPKTTAFVSDPVGKFTFSFTTPSTADLIKEGILNIGFDVAVAAVDTTRHNANRLAAVRWHIRNGLTVNSYDNGKDDNTNIGAGLVFAYKDAYPEPEDTYVISVSPGDGSAVTGPTN